MNASTVRAAALLLALCAACSDSPVPVPPAPTDLCNSPAEALAEAPCQLTLGQDLERLLAHDGDEDWYAVTLPAALPSPALLQVVAGGGERRTAVRLDVQVLREDGAQPVGRAVSRAAGAALDLLLPWAEPGARLLVRVKHDRDAGGPTFDAQRPYVLRVELRQDPDAHEPNDEVPTPLTLTPQPDGTLRGEAQGALASQGDVDRYAFSLTSGQRVQVLYVELTSPQLDPAPASPLRYVLTQQGAGELAGAAAPDGGAPVRLASAHTVWPGTVPPAPLTTHHVLEVRSAEAVTPGDLRQTYRVEVRVLEREDANEPNGAPELARVETLPTPGVSRHTFTGRLDVGGDEDWLAVDLEPVQRPTVLHYKLVPRDAGGRFPPLAQPDRLLTVRTQLQGAASQTACREDPAVCPGTPTTALATAAREAACARAAPHCLHALRSEDTAFGALHNFEGVLPIPAHGSTLRLFFQLASASGRYADDREYQLELRWDEDEDEATRQEAEPRPLREDPRQDAGIAPPAGDDFEVHGTLLAGHGLRSAEASAETGVRGPEDYDALASDEDVFTFSLPSALPPPMDRTWKLQWEVAHAADGAAPHGLAVDLTFCDADSSDGSGCVPVSVGTKGSPLTLRHLGAPRLPWHAPETGVGPLRLTHREEDALAGLTTVTLTEEACPCLEPRFLRGGVLRMRVSAVDRTAYAPVRYTLRTAWGPYPRSFASDAGMLQCPAQCAFTREP